MRTSRQSLCTSVAIACAVGLVAAAPSRAAASLPVLDESAWELRPDWIGEPDRRSAGAGYTVRDGIAHFRVPESGRAMSVRASLPEPIDLDALPFLRVRYRAVGVTPAYGRQYFLWMHSSETGGSAVIRLEELLLNGRWHTQVLEPHASLVFDEAALHLAVGADGGELQIASVEFLPEYPHFSVADSFSGDLEARAAMPESAPVPIDEPAAVPAQEVQETVGLSDRLPTETFAYGGVPYEPPPNGRAALIPRYDEGELVVPCAATAREIHFIMAARLPKWQPKPFTPWGAMKRALAQVERLSVFLDYADGTTDQVFPYCPDTSRFELCRGLKAYAAPAAAKPLKAVRFAHDARNARLYLCALTARTGAPLHAAAYAPDTPPAVDPPEVAPTAPLLELVNDHLTIANAYYALHFDLRPTFRLTGIDRAGVATAPTLFSARRGTEPYRSDEMTVIGEPRLNETSVHLRLRPPDSLPAVFDLTLQADSSPELVMELSVTNEGRQPLGLEVVFPHLRRLRVGDLADTWYFYPSHCARLTRGISANRRAYGGRFPLQFFSVFNPRLGRGVYVATRDRTGVDRHYELAKRFDGVEARIRYPDSLVIAPGGTLELPETVLALHPGDWHQALAAYREWARPWYLEGNVRPEWFRRVTNMRTFNLQDPGKNHRQVRDPETGRYRVDEVLDEEERRFGRVDYAHFFDYRVSEQFGRWGDYDEFSAIGGAEGFSRCLRQFEARGCRLGLYMEGFLASGTSKVAQEHAEQWRIERRGGGFLSKHSTPGEPVYGMCPFMPGWRRHLADTAARLVRQFDVDGIYLDEFGFNSSGYYCYREDHPHPVPGRPLQGVMATLREVKESLPDDIALYTEECPADVASQHADGSFSYFLSYNDPPHTPGRLSAYRFAFPEFRLLALSAQTIAAGDYIDQPKFVLFNGLGYYGSGIIIVDQAERSYRETIRVLQEHREAFNSLEAEPLIPTETPGILANRFPGPSETVYTVFNTMYHTVRCPVVRIAEHQQCRLLYGSEEMSVQRREGAAVVHLTLGPRAVACFCCPR